MTFPYNTCMHKTLKKKVVHASKPPNKNLEKALPMQQRTATTPRFQLRAGLLCAKS
ncbi:hypothetical protein GE21DRAFT_1351612 [Neurospora crassa]|nr:hypothetical protein GE21DRAFT_1351612 [Neurospora crassa]